MSSADVPARASTSDRAIRVALGVVLLVGLALRVHASIGRELWLDDIQRGRLSELPWEHVFFRIHEQGAFGSPYLIAFHKLWTSVAGLDEILPARGLGILCGLGLCAGTYLVAARASTPARGLASAAWMALDPFFIRWSVEIHNYAPAACFLLAAFAVALRAGGLTPGRLALVALLAAAGVAMFPALAPAAACLFLLPQIRAVRGLRAWGAALLVVALVGAWPLVSTLRGLALFRASEGGGVLWSPYFNWRRTPFEIAARWGGLDVRQGAGTRVHALWAAAVGAVVAYGALRRGADASVRRALVVAGFAPAFLFAALSLRGTGFMTDRYVHVYCALAPAAVFVVWPWPSAGAAARCWGPRFALGALLAVPLAIGFAQMIRDGDRFPRDLTNRSYRSAVLVRGALAGGPAPAEVLVHGETLHSFVVHRTPLRGLGVPVRHLTTAAWLDRLARGDRSLSSIPLTLGWPFQVEALGGPGTNVARDDAARTLAAGGSVWLVLEHPPLVRKYLLEEEEVEGGLDGAWQALSAPASAERTQRIRDGVARYLRLPGSAKVRVTEDSTAALVRIDP